jgi:hypothetical protein
MPLRSQHQAKGPSIVAVLPMALRRAGIRSHGGGIYHLIYVRYMFRFRRFRSIPEWYGDNYSYGALVVRWFKILGVVFNIFLGVLYLSGTRKVALDLSRKQ